MKLVWSKSLSSLVYCAGDTNDNLKHVTWVLNWLCSMKTVLQLVLTYQECNSLYEVIMDGE